MNKRTINGRTLTSREIDVVSCIVNIRGAKKIAAILSISVRTAERHIQNIMVKVGCNSQEGIKDFVEQSADQDWLKQHYINLTVQNMFELQLKKISSLIKNKNIKCFIRYENANDKINHLIKHLGIAGIQISISNTGLNDSSKHNTIHILPNNSKGYILQDQNEKNYIFLTFNDIKTSGNNIINCKDANEYYDAVFQLLMRMAPNVDINEFVLAFKNRFNKARHTNVQITPETQLTSQNNVTQIHNNIILLKNLRALDNKGLLMIGLFFVFAIVAGMIVLLNNTNKINFSDNKQVSSNLALPHENILLSRDSEINKITKIFSKSKKDNIPTVIIVGLGGW